MISKPRLLASASQGVLVPLTQPKRQAHVLVRNVACAMAAEVYEELARHNRFYAAFPDIQRYVDETWWEYLRTARETLTDMLTSDRTPQDQKDEIENALQLDFGLAQAAAGNVDFKRTDDGQALH